MKIMSYVELNRAQEHAIEGFENAVVRATLINPSVVATFMTFQGQEVKATINSSGVITHIEVSG